MTEAATRRLEAEIDLAARPERVFDALVTPSAVRDWWAAARVVVVPRRGGVWAAAWGAEEDDPDYVTTAVMSEFERPRRLTLTDYDYRAKGGPAPFAGEIVTRFEITPADYGAHLRVTQTGFPADSSADEFYEACRKGWRDTLEGLRRHLEGEGL